MPGKLTLLTVSVPEHIMQENAIDTFSSHAELDALLEAAVLALVSMMLIYGTVATAAARVGQVATHRALEETLASLARQNAVVLAGAFVTADDTLGRRQLLLLRVMMMLMVMRHGLDVTGLVGRARTGRQGRRRSVGGGRRGTRSTGRRTVVCRDPRQ